MAEKNSTSNAAFAVGPDGQLDLKKRARRRLVGAIALVLLAVIVLPMVMDQEPKPLTQDIQIRIPSQEPGSNSFISRIKPNQTAPTPTPLPAETKIPPAASPSVATATDTEAKTKTKALPPAESKPEPPKPITVAAPAPGKTPEVKAPAKPAEKPAAAQNAESKSSAPRTSDEHWIVQLGAYQDQGNVKLLQGKIKELGYPVFTEKVDTPQGSRVRVRCGPFSSREAAEKAQGRLKKIGAGSPFGGIVAKAQ